ncbi:MAG TPA: hypothetical protein DCQ93_10110 [Bacteroidetes bacterium]|nr:hypothetical protein [Bacteroidota bacterium]
MKPKVHEYQSKQNKMNIKKIVVVALLSFISLSSFAQTETTGSSDGASKGFRFGLQFSPQLDWLKAQDNHTTSSGVKFGFNYGLMADFSLASNYAIATGLTISQNSADILYNDSINMFNSLENDTFPQLTKTSYKLQYIEIPFLLKLKTNEIGYITYFGQFGINAGLNTKTRGTIDDPSNKNDIKNENLGADISPFNMSLNIGAGIEYSLSKSTAFVTSLSFHNGFLDISDSPKGFKTKSILNQVELRLGILF